MICYEVNIKIKNEVFSDYLDWLKPHIRQMLKFDGFTTADLFQEITETEDGSQKITVNYYIENKEKLDHYLKNSASLMRNDGIEKFADLFSIERRIFKKID